MFVYDIIKKKWYLRYLWYKTKSITALIFIFQESLIEYCIIRKPYFGIQETGSKNHVNLLSFGKLTTENFPSLESNLKTGVESRTVFNKKRNLWQLWWVNRWIEKVHCFLTHLNTNFNMLSSAVLFLKTRSVTFRHFL